MPEATDPLGIGKAGIEGETLLRKPGDLPAWTILDRRTGCSATGKRAFARTVRGPLRFPLFILEEAMTVTLHVCITCRAGETLGEGETTPGKRLHGAILEAGVPDGVSVVPVECLPACNKGCSVALSAPGRWSYVYGRLSDANASDVVAGAAAYAAAPDGLVPWRSRPEIFRKQSLARIPPILPLAVVPEAAE
jgi:predicted metal-binding protein